MKVDVGGNSTQVQYQGYNKLETELPTDTHDNVTITHNSDGSYTINGTSTTSFNFISEQKTLPAGDYTFQAKYEGTLPNNGSLRAFLYNIVNILNNEPNTTIKIFTLTETTNYKLYIRIQADFNYQNVKLYPLLVSGIYTLIKMPSFEPYVGGQASPNPIYKQDINNVTGDVVVKVSSKNFFDENIFLNASGWTKNNEVYSGLVSSLYAYFSNIQIDFKENTQYTLSLKGYVNETGGNIRFQFVYSDDNVSAVYITATTLSSYYLISTAGKTIKSLTIDYGSGRTLYIKEFQLEQGTSATSYVPYSTNTVTFPLSSGQKLMLGDKLESDGIHHKRGQVVLTGTETGWSLITEYTNNIRYDCSSVLGKPDGSVKSNYFVEGTAGTDTTNIDLHGGNGRIIITAPKTIATTLQEFTTWLAQKYANNTRVIVEYD